MARINRSRGIVIYLFLALLPIALLFAYVTLVWGLNFLDFHPVYDDEVHHWRKVATFSVSGFSAGFFTFEEHLPVIKSVSYDAHGPGYAMIYGSIARLTDWHPNSPILFNSVAIVLSLIFLFVLLRPGLTESIVVTLLLIVSGPVLLEIPSGMQESLHISFAIVFAALITYTINHESVIANIVLLGLIVVASIVRPTWAILLPLYFFFWSEKKPGGAVLTRLLMMLVLAFSIFFVFFMLSAPYPNFISRLLDLVANGGNAKGFFLSHLIINMVDVLISGEGGELFLVFRVMSIFFVGLLVLAVIEIVRRSGFRQEIFTSVRNRSLFSALFIVLTIFVALLLMYEAENYPAYRTLASFVVLSLMLVALSVHKKVLAPYIILGIVFFPIFIDGFNEIRQPNFVKMPAVEFEDLAIMTDTVLPIDLTEDGWCKTIAVGRDSYCVASDCSHMLSFPSGLAITALNWNQRIESPLQSKYFLLTDERRRAIESRFGRELEVYRIAKTSYGDLYYNMESKCSYDLSFQLDTVTSLQEYSVPGEYVEVNEKLSNDWTLLGYQADEEALASGNTAKLLVSWLAPVDALPPGSAEDGWTRLAGGHWLYLTETARNLLTNGDFETRSDDDTVVGFPGNMYRAPDEIKQIWEVERDQGVTRVGVLANNQDVKHSGLVSETFAVSLDTVYLQAGWVLSENGRAFMGRQWGGELSDDVRNYSYVFRNLNTGEWRHYSGVAEPLSGSENVRVWLLNYDAEAEVMFDDVLLIPIPNPVTSNVE